VRVARGAHKRVIYAVIYAEGIKAFVSELFPSASQVLLVMACFQAQCILYLHAQAGTSG